jgi:hypothetical protein
VAYIRDLVASGYMSWQAAAFGALGGSSVTYVLTWYREHRRSAEMYRTPQRSAVGDILEATNELVIRGARAAEAIDAELASGKWIRQPGGAIDTNRIDPPLHDLRCAASKLIRALDLGRIVLVDPKCNRALNDADEQMSTLKAFLGGQPSPRNFVYAPLYKNHLVRLINDQEASVDQLLSVSTTRLGPVTTFGTRLWRFGHRIDSWATAKTAEWRRLEEAERSADEAA